MKTKNPAKRILKTAVIQMQSKPYALNENLQLALNLAKEAHNKGANLIVLPELFDSGYCVNDKDADFGLDFKAIEYSEETLKNETLRALSGFAKSSDTHIVACSIEKNNKKLYDSAYIISPKGKIVGKHRKIYLWGDEKSRFKRGKKYEVFTLDFGDFSAKVGLQICYEIGFGVGANLLALQGAEVLIYPSAFGKARAYNWDLLSKARALENGCFVCACNHSGEETNAKLKQTLEFAGDSRIIAPNGKIIAQATKLNEVIIAEMDLNEVALQHQRIPYLQDFDTKLTKKGFGKLT
ncbi:carbon-nitrogen hydrolase family protein [Helicobacter pylori]|uniref:Putative N-carbomoyl-D-amino acid amidohydrolase n=1 Tax=Helicobacter pylori Hp H-24 TaxID=992039 RepID=J0KMI1_HELPX|nr:carbon-nitrogen hydrolase family protein [Helicobacter pylori]EJB51975.1 putative N-carbomoyl-D-amino acid amidohydrolase [Helicobacter pylori Hp H-24]EJC19822.1 carbon-nitrogen hydrolase family protein [Helicobacter pylori Hp H-24b]EJC20853.1 carbon-nitrogen hydrolase family protein [Helicobacter pylori Hp H-24c]EJC40691.1 putative N-carbomoyl-D-amino acid amidohydrolase [Helicobacter pylori Hp M1]EJC42826.1 putative N-carbomoyl-D-amino acid amidohydrolase [Helicobacter pylori Hp M2]